MASTDITPPNLSMAQPTTSHEMVRLLEAQYESFLASGRYQPFLYPWGALGGAVILAYLMIDHRQSVFLQTLKWPVWLFNVAFSIYCILFVRARNPAASLGVGLISAWSVLWTANLLIFRDAQKDFSRIERSDLVARDFSNQSDRSGTSVSSASPTSQSAVDKGAASNDLKATPEDSQSTWSGNIVGYIWQPYPSRSMLARLDWVADVFTTFRGVTWNWSILRTGPPEHVQRSLPALLGDPHGQKPAAPSPPDRSTTLRHNLYIFLQDALILDLVKTHASHDPYFWGLTQMPLPSIYPAVVVSSPVLTKVLRLLVALFGMNAGLEIIFSLDPLFFVGILGPKFLGVRGETWTHPEQFGSFDYVLDKGLAGWWGGWWHQTFKRAFVVAGESANNVLRVDPKSKKGKAIGLLTAFGLSGVLHAAASCTQIGETRPFRGPFVFFVSQAVGILLEMGIKDAMKQSGVSLPSSMSKVGNFIFAHWWLYLTAPLLIEDFAQGGVFLFEPIPISLFRGPLRLGDAEDTFWRWQGTIPRWHAGDRWWKTGIAL